MFKESVPVASKRTHTAPAGTSDESVPFSTIEFLMPILALYTAKHSVEEAKVGIVNNLQQLLDPNGSHHPSIQLLQHESDAYSRKTLKVTLTLISSALLAAAAAKNQRVLVAKEAYRECFGSIFPDEKSNHELIRHANAAQAFVVSLNVYVLATPKAFPHNKLANVRIYGLEKWIEVAELDDILKVSRLRMVMLSRYINEAFEDEEEDLTYEE
ncbi:hypothetical protein BDF20DRAFT_1002716 [Mycotypha africana]|uniref:uncharacterized protein n=1 Tax=Mycotypha africana TaxID=64632 RepID=UPI002300B3AC|nr:uncharacterized protein BDF20DRAFT_1002716 [Mycotypha africana]KAI8973838.1 hypothetical protein BDF20DRAFT_1002716 [Mycotypha africana]